MLVAQAGKELADQTRLPDASRAEDGEQVAYALVDGLLESIGQQPALTLTADHRRIQARATGWRSAPSASSVSRYALERLDLALGQRLGRPTRAHDSRTSRYVLRRSAPRRPRRLLEPRGHVHRIALTKRWPPPASPATTSPVLMPVRQLMDMPRSRSSSVAHGSSRVPDLGRGTDRPQRVVLVDGGNTKDGHHRVADVLLDRSAVALDDLPDLVEVARHHAPQRLGVDALAKAVEPTASMNMTVTVLRTSLAFVAAAGARALPQLEQNRAPSSFSWPHRGQAITRRV